MSGDAGGAARLTLAREYLDGAQSRKVTELPPSVLVRELAETRRQLGLVLDVIERQDDEDGTEPYCTRCGSWAGMFHGLDGWHHFRGDPAPGGVRELYDAGHEPVIGWTVPAGRALSPGQLATVLDALDVAAEYKRDRVATCPDCEASPADLCGTCEWRLARADEYDALAEVLRGQQ